MKAYKFVVGTEQFVPLKSDPRISVKSVAAVVIAETREQAVEILKADLEAHSEVPWWEVATVTEFPLDPSVVLVVQMP